MMLICLHQTDSVENIELKAECNEEIGLQKESAKGLALIKKRLNEWA